MSIEEIQRAATNREAADLAEADNHQAQRVVALWMRPAIADSDIPEALSIPPSLWAALKKEGDSPPLFLLGRRLFARTDDLKAWLDAKASAGKPGSRRLRLRTRREAV